MLTTTTRPSTRLADLLAPYGGQPLAFANATRARHRPSARVRMALWLRAVRGSAS